MAQNRLSPDCPTICAFDKYVKENYMRYHDYGTLAAIRGYMDYDNSEFRNINEILTRGGALSAEQEKTIQQYVSEVTNMLQDESVLDALKEKAIESGSMKTEIAAQYGIIKDAFPRTSVREDIREQLLAAVLDKMAELEARPENANLTSEEILTLMGGKNGISKSLRNMLLLHRHNKEVSIDEENGKPKLIDKNEKARVDWDVAKEGAEALDLILGKSEKSAEVWHALMFFVMKDLNAALNTNIGTDIDYVSEDDGELMFDKEGRVIIAEEHSPEHWMLTTDTISAYHSLALDTRAILHRVRMDESKSQDAVGIFRLRRISDVMGLYSKLMGKRSLRAYNNSRDFINDLENSPDKEYRDIAAILSKDPYKATTFFNSFRKNLSHYFYYQMSSGTDKKMFVKRVTVDEEYNEVKVKAYMTAVFDIDESNERCLFNSKGMFVASHVAGFLQRFKPWGESRLFVDGQPFEGNLWDSDTRTYNTDLWFLDKDGNRTTPTTTSEKEVGKRAFILDVSDSLNMHLNDDDINELMNSDEKFVDFCTAVQRVAIAFEHNKITNRDSLTIVLKNSKEMQKAINNLIGKSVSQVSVEERTSPIERGLHFDKSTYMAHTTCSTLGDMIEDLRRAYQKGPESLKTYLEKKYFQCPIFATKRVVNGRTVYDIKHLWLRQLYLNAGTKNNDFIRAFLDAPSRGLGHKNRTSKAFENYSEKDNLIMSIFESIFSSIESSFYAAKDKDGTIKFVKTSAKITTVPLFVTGDSNATRYLNVPFRTQTEVLNDMSSLIDSELERMLMMEDFNQFCADHGYSLNKMSVANSSKWVLLDFLNDSTKDRISEIKKLYRATKVEAVTDEDIAKKEEALAAWSTEKERLKVLVEQSLEKGWNTFRKDLINSGIAVPGAGFNTATLNPETLFVTEEVANDAKMLKDVYYNSKLHLMLQMQFTTVDPGFYRDVQDLQKRYKEMVAAGTPLDMGAIDPQTGQPFKKAGESTVYQNVIYIDEIKKSFREEANAAELEEVWKTAGHTPETIKKYESSTLTDGQSWREFSSYRQICLMAGGNMWSKAHEQAYQKIMSFREEARTKGADYSTSEEGRKARAELIKEIESLGVVFQPIKPFYFGFNSPISDRSILVPTQLKYSEYPVIPELLPLVPVKDEHGNITGWKESKLAALGRAMAENQIDLAADSSCVKVGLFGSVNTRSFNSFEDFHTALQSKDKDGNSAICCHVLDLAGYRVQSNIPEHMNSSRAIGSQLINHLLMVVNENLRDTKEYPKAGGKTSLRQVINEYTKLSASRYVRAAKRIYNKYTSVGSLAKVLSELKSNDSRAPLDLVTSYTTNETGTDLLCPLSEGASLYDNMASLLSSLRKELIKQPVRGGSAVQVSAYGYEDVLQVQCRKTNDGKTNIVAADIAVAFDFDYVDSQGNHVSLNYTDYVDPSTGCLLGLNGEPIDQPADPEPGVPGREHYGWNTKMGHEYPGSLDLIAYRIPTEKAYSIINCRVKRFFPKTAGGIIMVPTMFTTVAGFDFDIDKLYFIRREFRENTMSESQQKRLVNKVWNDIYGKRTAKSQGTSYIYRRLKEAQARATAGLEEGSGTVVAQASTTGASDNTIGAANPQLLALREKMNEEFREQMQIGTEEEEEDGQEVEGGGEEVEGESRYANETHEHLFEYWEQAGLDKSVEEGGIGMTATEYFQKYFSENRRKYVAFQRFNAGKPVLSNSQTAVNNRLFDIMQSRLEDVATLQERTTPGGYAHLQAARPMMRALRYMEKEDALKVINSVSPYAALKELSGNYEDWSPAYSVSELSTIAYYQTANAVSDKLIGMAANSAINLRITALFNKFELKTPIRWGSMLDRKDLDEGVGVDLRKKLLGGVDTELSVVEFLSSAVDGVKDSVIEFFNVDDSNFSSAMLAARIGAKPEDLGLLLNQPVVTEALKLCKETPGLKFGEALSEALINIGVDKDMVESFIHSFEEEKGKKDREQYLSTDALTISSCLGRLSVNDIHGLNHTANFHKSQIAIVSLLKELAVASKELSDEVAVSKFTSQSSVQATLGSLEATEERLIEFSQKFGGPDSAFEVVVNSNAIDPTASIDPHLRIVEGEEELFLYKCANSPYGIQQACYSGIMGFVDRVISTFFPFRTEGFKRFKGSLKNISTSSRITDECYDLANKDLMVACISQMMSNFSTQKHVQFAGKTIPVEPNIFYNKLFPILFYSTLKILPKQDADQIALFKTIVTATEKSGEVGEKSEIKIASIGNLTREQKDTLISSWEEAFNSKNPVLRELAEHLFYYSFFNNGFDYGRTTFMSLVPSSFKMSLTDGNGRRYTDFFKSLQNIRVGTQERKNQFYIAEEGPNSESTAATAFPMKPILKSFILNRHSKFSYFRKYASRESKNKIMFSESYIASGGNSFTLDFTNTSALRQGLDSFAKTTVIKTERGVIKEFKFVPIIILDNNIYMCDNNLDDVNGEDGVNFNVTRGSMTYYKVDPKVGLVDYSGVEAYGATLDKINTALEVAEGARDRVTSEFGGYKLLAAINSRIDLLAGIKTWVGKAIQEGEVDNHLDPTEEDELGNTETTITEKEYWLGQLRRVSEVVESVLADVRRSYKGSSYQEAQQALAALEGLSTIKNAIQVLTKNFTGSEYEESLENKTKAIKVCVDFFKRLQNSTMPSIQQVADNIITDISQPVKTSKLEQMSKESKPNCESVCGGA